MKQTHKKHGLTKEELTHLYLELRLSDKEIGDRFGLTDVAVSYHRRKHGIQTLSQRDRIGLSAKDSGLRDVRSVEREEFVKLYCTKGERGLARLFGSSRQLIRQLRDEYAIPAMDKLDRIKEACPESFSIEQRQIMYGSILGDGGVSLADNGQTARFHEFHSFEQIEYLKWKQTVLHPFSKKVARSDKMLEDGRIAYGYSFNTSYHPLFLEYWNRFYWSGVKRLPVDFEDSLCPMSMAVWYMDDGHLSDRNKDGVFTLSSGLPKEDIDRIVSKMNEYGWDAEDRVGEDITIIWINNKDRFYKYIAPYVRPTMMYKIPCSLRGDVPSFYRWKGHIEMFKVDFEKISDENIDHNVEKFFKYWRSVGFSYPYCSKEFRQKEIAAMKSSSIDLSSGVIPSGYSQGTSLCSTFFDGIWKAKRKGKKSPLDVFNDDKLLRHAIRDCITYRKSLSESELRSEIQTFGGVHNFRPIVAKSLYDKYCPVGGSILDPCSGWGGRLLGFMCSHASRYVGVDVEDETVRSLRMMFSRLGKEFSGKTVEINNSPFEKFETTEKFDLAFTSPPYFDAEWYGHCSLQSQVQYSDYDSWRDRFLYVLIERAIGALKNGGRLILNVANVESGPVSDDARAMIEERIGEQEVLKMLLPSRYGGEARYEEVIVSKVKQGGI